MVKPLQQKPNGTAQRMRMKAHSRGAQGEGSCCLL